MVETAVHALISACVHMYVYVCFYASVCASHISCLFTIHDYIVTGTNISQLFGNKSCQIKYFHMEIMPGDDTVIQQDLSFCEFSFKTLLEICTNIYSIRNHYINKSIVFQAIMSDRGAAAFY